ILDSTTPALVCPRLGASHHLPSRSVPIGTVPRRRAAPAIHDPRPSEHGGRGINHLAVLEPRELAQQLVQRGARVGRARREALFAHLTRDRPPLLEPLAPLFR